MNWTGTARSNYFLVKDADAFKAAMALLPIQVEPSDSGRFAVLAQDDDGDWPDMDRDGEPCEVWAIVSEHLADGEVAVFVTVGHEGQRYLTGHTIAFTNKDEPITMDLEDIYARAKHQFGVDPTHASY